MNDVPKGHSKVVVDSKVPLVVASSCSRTDCSVHVLRSKEERTNILTEAACVLWLPEANIECKSLCMHSDVLRSQMSHESSASSSLAPSPATAPCSRRAAAPTPSSAAHCQAPNLVRLALQCVPSISLARRFRNIASVERVGRADERRTLPVPPKALLNIGCSAASTNGRAAVAASASGNHIPAQIQKQQTCREAARTTLRLSASTSSAVSMARSARLLPTSPSTRTTSPSSLSFSHARASASSPGPSAPERNTAPVLVSLGPGERL